MYGVVYHDEAHQPQLLVIERNQISIGAISDDEKVYTDLPPEMGEIVEVHHNVKTEIVGLKSICCLSLHSHGVRFTVFYKGVNTILSDEPSDLASIIMAGVERNAKRTNLVMAEGAEVIEWPDGTMVLAEDYRPEQWTHMSDDFDRRWRSPRDLRKLGLL